MFLFRWIGPLDGRLPLPCLSSRPLPRRGCGSSPTPPFVDCPLPSPTEFRRGCGNCARFTSTTTQASTTRSPLSLPWKSFATPADGWVCRPRANAGGFFFPLSSQTPLDLFWMTQLDPDRCHRRGHPAKGDSSKRSRPSTKQRPDKLLACHRARQGLRCRRSRIFLLPFCSGK
jgi:hypothetical protein